MHFHTDVTWPTFRDFRPLGQMTPVAVFEISGVAPLFVRRCVFFSRIYVFKSYGSTVVHYLSFKMNNNFILVVKSPEMNEIWLLLNFYYFFIFFHEKNSFPPIFFLIICPRGPTIGCETIGRNNFVLYEGLEGEVRYLLGHSHGRYPTFHSEPSNDRLISSHIIYYNTLVLSDKMDSKNFV